MRFGKLTIAILTLLLMVAAVVTQSQEDTDEHHQIPLEFFLQTGDHTEFISCWEDPEGDYVVFLPGYGNMASLCAMPGDIGVEIGGRMLTPGMCLADFQLNQQYPLRFVESSIFPEAAITFVPTGYMPTLFLDVASGSMDYIHTDKSCEEPGEIRLYDADGTLLHAGDVLEVKGRGDSSWTAEKKPYNLTLAQETDMLGMGGAERWILLSEGANAVNIRNKIVYDFAAKLGMPYTPDCRWVDLYLNGEYAGLYLLSERNEIHPQRVDIPWEGSFLISMEDKQYLEDQKIAYVDTGSRQVVRLRYSGVEDRQVALIWQTLKKALLSPDGTDPVTGKHWQQLIDMDSWVKKYLIEEVFANPDGGVVSQFFYYNGAESEGKIYAGPVWDYDYAMGGENHWMRDYQSFLMMDREYADAGHYLPWFYELYHKEEFYQRLTELYETEVLPLLSELVDIGLNEYAKEAEPAMTADGRRWGYSQEAVRYDLDFIREFLRNREVFLSDLWIAGTEYHMVQVDPGRYFIGYFMVKDGECLSDLPDYEELGGLGWYNVDTAEPFDIAQPIYEDVSICVIKPESTLPVIHYLPAAAMILALSLLVLWDRTRTGRREKAKCLSKKQ